MDIRAGRLEKEMTKNAAEFTSSLGFDHYIFDADVECNIAHTSMLKEEDIIDKDVADKIIKTLNELKEEGFEALTFDYAVEDIHMAVENYVTDKIGDIAGFMHTAKSRNDQVATDIRLALKIKVREIQKSILSFMEGLVETAREHKETIIVGYTHLQHAQPVTFAHHLMAYAQSLKRDYERLEDTYKRVNINPLGSAAMATTTFPINRETTTNLLGFDSYMENSMDGVSARDFIAETVFDLTMLTTNLSKICEELVLWSSYEFSLIEISDEFSSTSSIMPQKKNPDVAEVARSKCAIINGNLVTVLTILKAIPYTYNRDLQELTPHLWNACESSHDILNIVKDMTLSIKVFNGRGIELAESNFATATDLADLMVKEKSIPFRVAHEIVGKVVNEAFDNCIMLDNINSDFINRISVDIIGEELNLSNESIRKALDPVENVKLRNIPGGPSPEMVEIACKNTETFLEKEFEKCNN
ncbi:argininosuccinate lyase [Methanobrevibacter filiformis]|uniref:Argininosuccinate lyase n=1 Tax=Methanobrevibacter filiformis TaxID=55758 RepID=A0A166EWC1_9EURY|nr:argininosuccinate lyase [Methanobrevibacter filiformis]KZX17083.1 argininosuccinate lyase 1 [Methanobrevibacter filiformis]